MANLIPPDAKKAISIEYWIRVAVVWCLLISLGLVVVTVLKLPTFVLIQSQLSALSNAYDNAKVTEDSFTEAQNIINEANDLSFLLAASYATSTPLSEIATIIDEIAGREVTVTNFQFNKTDTEVTSINIMGVAETRSSLANFSKELEAHPLFSEANVPISNLAKDSDIFFNISITPTAQ